MKPFKKEHEVLVASEAFLRRASTFEHPFVLKGSLLTRQFVAADFERYVEDIDWVYPLPLKSAREAEEVFGNWINKVTKIDVEDRIEFELVELSIAEEAWSLSDYACMDDFPTIKTYLTGVFKTPEADYDLVLRLDISFNLELGIPPIQLTYKPLLGEPFIVPRAITLSQQIAWKLHQTITRPRYKDIYDLVYLMPYIGNDRVVKEQILQELVNECIANNNDINQLKWFINDKAMRYAYLKEENKTKTEEYRKLKKELANEDKSSSNNSRSFMYQYLYGKTTNEPILLSQLLAYFQTVLIDNGFTLAMFENLPPYSRKKISFIASEPPLYETKSNKEENEMVLPAIEKPLTFIEKLKRFFALRKTDQAL
ncbi:MAG: nucleotidyl transferase AbiEii/AbiGii toxin family protein [Bacteroidota bacterium]